MNKKILIAFIITMACMFVMQKLNDAIRSPVTPTGMLNFQMAKTIEEADHIIEVVGNKKMKTNTYFDFAFIFAYSTLMFLCCKALMDNYNIPILKKIGFVFLETSLAIGAFDVLENIVMLMTLSGNGSKLSVSITHYACMGKWVAAAIVGLYIFISSVLVIFTEVRTQMKKTKNY